MCVRETEGHCPSATPRCVTVSRDRPQHNSNQGPSEEERRANRNVEIRQTVSAEPLAVRTHPQEDGLGTVLAAIAPAQLIMTSVRPQATHDNNQLCQATVFDAVAAMIGAWVKVGLATLRM